MATKKPSTDIAVEVQSETAPEPEGKKFTVEIQGEQRTFVDQTDEVPGVAMMMGNERYAMRYYPDLLESILGAEQLDEFMSMHPSLSEMQELTQAWSKARGLGN